MKFESCLTIQMHAEVQVAVNGHRTVKL